MTGVYIFLSAPPPSRGEGGNNISYWLVGENMRRKREYEGREVKKKGKRGNFHFTWEGGTKISYAGQYIHP